MVVVVAEGTSKEAPFESLPSKLWRLETAGAKQALDERGIWVADASVDGATASALRNEILSLHETGLLQQSGNVLSVRLPDGSRSGKALRKHHVFEADVITDGVLERPDVLSCCPMLAALLAEEGALRDILNAAKPSLGLCRLDQAKVQVNSGCGGAFPFHFDVSSVQDSRRLLTAILYLNPSWMPGDGGEVEALPFPFPDVSVSPLNSRLVVFSALGIMHRVCPFIGSTHGNRVCINLWFDGDVDASFPRTLPVELESCRDGRLAKIVSILRRRPAELRAFCKMWYRSAIAESFRETFEPCADLEAAMVLHDEEAREIESRIAPQTLAVLRASLPLEIEKQAPEVKEEKADEGLADLFDFD